MIGSARTRRKWLLPAIAGIVTVAVIAAWRVFPVSELAQIGAGYAAEQTCACLFVSGRSLESCRGSGLTHALGPLGAARARSGDRQQPRPREGDGAIRKELRLHTAGLKHPPQAAGDGATAPLLLRSRDCRAGARRRWRIWIAAAEANVCATTLSPRIPSRCERPYLLIQKLLHMHQTERDEARYGLVGRRPERVARGAARAANALGR